LLDEGVDSSREAAVELVAAKPDDEALLRNLLELYVHELSAFFPVAIGADGRFGYPKLPLYWTEVETRFPFLIRFGDRPAGFALATRGSPATRAPDDMDVAEFFVLRSHRRAGVGSKAAALLWRRFPGPWVVRVSEANRPGLAFWTAVVRGFTGGTFSQSQLPGDPHPWRVLAFRSPA
jgi:predicted acetyltransferase